MDAATYGYCEHSEDHNHHWTWKRDHGTDKVCDDCGEDYDMEHQPIVPTRAVDRSRDQSANGCPACGGAAQVVRHSDDGRTLFECEHCETRFVEDARADFDW